MREHIRTITDFLSAHGAQRIKPEPTNGGHIRINYLWRGHTKFCIVPSTPSEIRGTKNTLAQLRRELGKPISHIKNVRTLDELVADLVPKTPEEPVMSDNRLQYHPEPFSPEAKRMVRREGLAYIGMGHYDIHHPEDERKALRVSIPEHIWEAAGSPEHVAFSRVDDGTWKITAVPKSKLSASWRKGRPGYLDTDISNPPEIYKDLGVWGKTQGESVVVDNEILISVGLTQLKPIRKRETHKVNPERLARAEALASTHRNIGTYSKEDIKKALDVISYVAQTMPVKLIRLPNGKYDFRLDLGC